MTSGLARRFVMALAALLLGYGLIVLGVGLHMSVEQEDEVVQRLSHGLARHIVEHWPEVAKNSTDAEDVAARDALLHMLMVVNPAIEVYVLDMEGHVRAFVGEWSKVRATRVDLAPVRAFLAGAALPLRGTDPKSPTGRPKVFSAAMFPAAPAGGKPPGYLYVVLEGEARSELAGNLGARRVAQIAAVAGLIGLVATWLVGVWTFQRLGRPLQRLTERIQAYMRQTNRLPAQGKEPAATVDEVAAIGAAFDRMVARVDEQIAVQERTQAAHREMIAGVAHDLRTPLTVLHGHLEALAAESDLASETRRHHVNTALAQSNSVRRLSQQLFELATLESADYALQRERFRLDELVSDAVRKFDLAQSAAPVILSGESPGPVNVEGDLPLIERALTNLIDNALRHARNARPVEVTLRCDSHVAQVRVQDHGPGLPVALARRLDAGDPVRDARTTGVRGGTGGFGLAIAQRVAQLHGGSLRAHASNGDGTCLCLSLPLTNPPIALPAPADDSRHAGASPAGVTVL